MVLKSESMSQEAKGPPATKSIYDGKGNGRSEKITNPPRTPTVRVSIGEDGDSGYPKEISIERYQYQRLRFWVSIADDILQHGNRKRRSPVQTKFLNRARLYLEYSV